MELTLDGSVSLLISLVFSVIAFYFTCNVIPQIAPTFIKAGLFGIDLCKTDKSKIPEAIGVVSGCIFLITVILFIPVPFGNSILNVAKFPHDEFVTLLAALLSICCMLLLGFADDVLDLRWRYKILLPTIASLPLLVVYYVNFNSTNIAVPIPLRQYLGGTLNIGILYYVYMGLMAVFCTNAINIYAGINGLEVGQSVIIAISIIIFNLIEVTGDMSQSHRFSLYIMLPYTGTTLALLKYNRFPSKVFIGDTFCYLSGMTFAVVGILGHFSKTVILFFIPQLINALYSMPQLFRVIPCPRHRLPKYDASSNKLGPSVAIINKVDLGIVNSAILYIFKTFSLIDYAEKGEIIVINNLTLLNFFLIKKGPMNEADLTKLAMIFQVFCSCLAFVIRYPIVSLFY